MSLKKEQQRRGPSAANRRTPRTELRNSVPTVTQTRHAEVVRRAGLDPDSLTPRDVLQLQRAVGNRAVARLLSGRAQRHAPPRKANATGLPDGLKAGVENLSGLSMDDVRVHYNSPRPAELQALAYTQGTDIHVGPGQERHLAHEAWHVVQQKQGRVEPTLHAKGSPVNDDAGLEREADAMGRRALGSSPYARSAAQSLTVTGVGDEVVQRYVERESTHDGDADQTWKARKKMGITARSKMNHNVAVDYNDDDNYHRSAKNGHGELMVVGMFGLKREGKKTLNIVSERQPCGACEADLKLFEEKAKPKLAITVDYFIEYEEGAGGKALWNYYVKKGKLDSSDSDEEMSS
jgi:hypothetical protein